MEELLSPVSRTYTKCDGTEAPLLHELPPATSKPPASSARSPTTVGEVLDILKNEPDYATLTSTLRLLARNENKLGGFDIAASGPEAAKVIHILVTEIAPNCWALLKESPTDDAIQHLNLLLGALRNLAGLNALLLRLRTLLHEHKSEATGAKRSDVLPNLSIGLELLCEVLDGDDRIVQMWSSISQSSDSVRQRILAREFVGVLGGGRIISLAAECEAVVVSNVDKTRSSWAANGIEYTRWLTRNILSWSKASQQPRHEKLAADLLSKAMHLGYPDAVMRLILSDLANESQEDKHNRALFENLAHSEQKSMVFSLLKALSDVYLNHLDPCGGPSDGTVISAAAGVIKELMGDEPTCASLLIPWLTSATGAGLGDACGIRRAALAVLASDTDNIVAAFDKSLTQFGDFLYIKHTPMLQQEVHAQVVLLSAGYLQRLFPMKLAFLVKGGAFMRMLSKRLEASQTRARLLGMIVGEALSGVVEESDKKLDFKMPETKTEEAMWYKSLVNVSDVIGPVAPLKSSNESSTRKAPSLKTSQKRSRTPKPAPSVSKAKAIIEVVASDEETEDDIMPMKKPDEDQDDSDDDPETVRRNRPKAPIYVRDLVTYLRDTEDYDRQTLALATAPALLRRKANFGTEVKEHAEEVASLLVGLGDKFDIENFLDLKLQGMIAIVVAQPQKMGPWFARAFFDGDFSMAQRSSVLTVLGLSARELAGHVTSEYTAAASFPSQALPEKMKKLYVEEVDSTKKQLSSSSSSTLKALPSSALDSIAKSLWSEYMAPIAANAADAATGPDALKLSTFTGRLSQQQKAKSKATPRVTAIPNTTAQLIATSFFFPLTARFQSALHSTASRARGIVFQPHLLSLYLKTLALLLHAAGPSTLALPDMTNELWGLLLGSSVRAHAIGDMGITQAVLFALLTMLEVNDNRMRDICQTMSREVVETQEWVAQVFGGVRGEDSAGEEAQVKALAAGCLVRIREGMEKYRMLLMGDMIG